MDWIPQVGFEGPLISFVDGLLDTFYPAPVNVRECQNWIDRQLAAGVGPFPCRAFTEAVMDRGLSVAPKVNFVDEGVPFPLIATDNEPTSSLFAYCAEGAEVWKYTMLSALQQRIITTGLLTTDESTPSTRAAFTRLGLGGGAMNAHWLRPAVNGLKLCHIADAANRIGDAKPASLRDELEVRICRTLSPLNVVPFPSPRKFTHTLDGRQYLDLGERPEIQKLFAAVHHRHLRRTEEGVPLPARWFERMRPGYSPEDCERALQTYANARVLIISKEFPDRLPLPVDGAVPRAPVVTQDQAPQEVVVSLAVLRALNATVVSRQQWASETRFCLRTDHPCWWAWPDPVDTF